MRIIMKSNEEEDGDNWRLLTGSSATAIYLPLAVQQCFGKEPQEGTQGFVAVGKWSTFGWNCSL